MERLLNNITWTNCKIKGGYIESGVEINENMMNTKTKAFDKNTREGGKIDQGSVNDKQRLKILEIREILKTSVNLTNEDRPSFDKTLPLSFWKSELIQILFPY